MKKFTLFLFLLIGTQNLWGQSYYFRVNFKHKGPTNFSLTQPLDYLSEKAINRRIKHHISVDSTDLPLCESYLSNLNSFPIIAQSKWLNCVVIELSDSSAITTIQNLDFVQSTSFLVERMPVSQAPPELRSSEYGIIQGTHNILKATNLHEKGFRGEGMLIAVLDAGFDYMNLNDPTSFFYDFASQIVLSKNFVNPSNSAHNTGLSHGTHVCATMGLYDPGTYIGSAPEAEFILCVTEDKDYEDIIEEFLWIQGAEFADSAGADLINTSLGYLPPNNNSDYLTGSTMIASIGLNIAVGKGIFCVTSAGNNGDADFPYILSPGEADSSFTVGALAYSEERAFFSAIKHPNISTVKPTVMAQGIYVPTAIYQGYSFSSGTSFSAPTISGWTACLMQAFPDKPIWEIRTALEQSAHLYSSPNDSMGFGIPNYRLAFEILSDHNTIDPLVVFPNPTSGQTFILSTSNDPLFVFDLSGKLILEINGRSAFELNLSELGQGVYILRKGKQQTRLVKL